MEFHPIADIFPLLDGEAFERLKDDIAENGLQVPIEAFDGRIIDGRNRFRACEELGFKTIPVEYEGEEADLAAYVVSLNLHRRHLSEPQRSMVAAKLSNLEHGGDRKSDQGANLHVETTIADAADMLNVSERSVKSARKVRDEGAQELQQAVEQGEVSISAAADVATLPKEEQTEVVARGEKEILQRAKEIRAEKAEVRRQERVSNLAEIAKGNAELNTETKYPIIYADPPWQYENPPMGGSNRSIENHYPTMTLEEICAMPVSELATDDALLYLWATAPKLAECMEVVTSWGFEYRTCFVWVKDKIGMGYHARNQHEILLVCKRGEIPPPAVEHRVSSVVHGERGEHSAKPERFYEIIENAYQELPKIELFCRSPRDGWSVWGNQSGEADGEAA